MAGSTALDQGARFVELELGSVLASNTRPARPITNDDERFSSAADIGVRVTNNAHEIVHFLRRRAPPTEPPTFHHPSSQKMTATRCIT